MQLLPTVTLSQCRCGGRDSLLTARFARAAAGPTRARDAALQAISSPLLEVGIDKATGVVWNITGPGNMSLFEVRRPTRPLGGLLLALVVGAGTSS